MIPQSKPEAKAKATAKAVDKASKALVSGATWPTTECNEVKNLINKENFTQIKSGQAQGARERQRVRVRAR